MAKTPSLNASIREVGISPTLKSVWDDLCRIILYVTNPPVWVIPQLTLAPKRKSTVCEKGSASDPLFQSSLAHFCDVCVRNEGRQVQRHCERVPGASARNPSPGDHPFSICICIGA